MIKLFWIFLFTHLLFSCNQHREKTYSDTVKEGNKSTTISIDTAKLSKLIDLSLFSPKHAAFKYVYIDNSGEKDRISIPGPSDSRLEAVLYFDDITFKKLKMEYFNIDYPSPGYNRQQFNFDWLDTSIRNELLNGDTSYKGHPDYFFGSGSKGKLWFLEDKLLLIKTTY